jgi:hypothetical protein
MLRIELSNRKDKRFVAIFRHGTRVHFGASEGSTYIDHKDKAKRAAYIARHGASGKENWEDPYTPGALSRWLLWGDYTSIDDNVAAFKRKFWPSKE